MLVKTSSAILNYLANILLNRVQARHRPVSAWFLEVADMHVRVCLCVCVCVRVYVCVCVCVHPEVKNKYVTSGVIWT